MRMVWRRSAVAAALLLFVIAAFVAGTAAYRVVRHNQQSQGLALYGSVLRVAMRSPLSLPSSSLSKQTDLRPLDTFTNVERRLRANYVEKIEDNTVLAFGTADNMLDSLDDPQSRFLEPEQLKAYSERLQGTYWGIGAVLATKERQLADDNKKEDQEEDAAPAGSEDDRDAVPAFDDPFDINAVRYEVFVVTTMPGSPAEKAGLRAGDTLRKVNGKYIYAKNLDTLETVLLTKREGSIRVEVTRKATPKPFTLTVPFGVTRTPLVSGRVQDGVGIVNLRVVGPGAADALRAKVREMMTAHVSGIVLDLRRDGDGNVKEAIAVASTFIGDGSVATLKERGGKLVDVPTEAGRAIGSIPRLAVLVDETTNGPAELVAAALKARGVGRLFGTVTLGRAGRQEIFPLPGNAAALMTTALFFPPAPHAAEQIEGKGVVPDVAVSSPKDGEQASDQALQRALAWAKNGAA